MSTSDGMGKYSKRKYISWDFLDKYPGILSVSDNTKVIIEDATLTGNTIANEILDDILSLNLKEPKDYFGCLERHGPSVEMYCLDTLQDLVVNSGGCNTKDYNMEIYPGCDTETLVVEYNALDIKNVSMDIKVAASEIMEILVDAWKKEISDRGKIDVVVTQTSDGGDFTREMSDVGRLGNRSIKS